MTTGATPEPFDVWGPLPGPGVTLLEASAGTGKTFTIAALTARYVAEGVPLDEMLVVTFTKAATGELRDRVRRQLAAAATGLERTLAGAEPADPLVGALAAGSAAEGGVRLERLRAALRRFDAATIDTTHGFCQRMLAGLGVAAAVPYERRLAENLSDLRRQVVDDLYVWRFHGTESPPLGLADARDIVTAALDNPSIPVEPTDVDARSDFAMRRRLAERARVEFGSRKAAGSVMDYEDLLVQLRSALADPTNGEVARRRLGDRFRVVLVDEFQDTDPVQWDVLRLAFAERTLVLIGDPKQAIYSFRGADVYAYLAAARGSAGQATLAVNWRSDQGLIDAYDALFGRARLGHAEILYRPVAAAPGHEVSGIAGAPVATPLRIRVVGRAGRGDLTAKGYLPEKAATAAVAGDVAADIGRLLAAGTTIRNDPPGGIRVGVEEAWRPLGPGDIAVLTYRNEDAAAVRDALVGWGVPAVVRGTSTVFATRAAGTWLDLLQALEFPGSRDRAAAVAVGDLVGWEAGRVATAGEADWEALTERISRWAGVLAERGVAALLQHVTRAGDLPARLLARPDGERLLTDLDHVGQLLHRASVADRPGLAALTIWLRRRMSAAREESGDDRLSRRLESDAEAVQVVTTHSSKGLEFPVVYAAFLWRPPGHREGGPFTFHDPDNGDARTLDVAGGKSLASSVRHWTLSLEEARGEELRLAYVALTRARHQAVVHWAPTWKSRESPLGRLLFDRGADGAIVDELRQPPDDDDAMAQLEDLAAGAGGTVAVEAADADPGAPPAAVASDPDSTSADGLDVAAFDRTIDRLWRRTSYSGITAAAHEADTAGQGISDEHTTAAQGYDEDDTAAQGADTEGNTGPDGRILPANFDSIGGGAAFGTFVHQVLETVDFAAADPEAECLVRIGEAAGRERFDPDQRGLLASQLGAALATPLGPDWDEVRLCDLARADRLDELTFELPVAGGDRPTGQVDPADIADLLDRHLPAGDLLAGYPARLRDPALARGIRGYLTGSIDLVLRLREPERFVVVDYKTNRLTPVDRPGTARDYRPEVLAGAMTQAHYPLQALLYAVALHRYLRWRLAGYDPAVNLPGAAYLFLRGMVGEETPRDGGLPCGVFTWRFTPGLVEETSDLLDQAGGASCLPAGPG